MTTWIGVDPGAKEIAVTARDGATLIGFRIIERNKVEPGSTRPGVATMEAVVEAIGQIMDPRTGQFLNPQDARVAVEDVVAPTAYHNGKLSMTDVEPLLRAAEVLGYVECAFPAAVRVRPDKHGRQTLASYPAALVTERERSWATSHGGLFKPAPQNSILRHARSGWDIAGAGAAAARLELALANHRR